VHVENQRGRHCLPFFGKYFYCFGSKTCFVEEKEPKIITFETLVQKLVKHFCFVTLLG
jgi:hypothetical protein